VGRLFPPRRRADFVIFRYTPCPVNSPIPGLGGTQIVPRPLLAVLITGLTGSRLRDGVLDTGADETVFDPSVAPLIGVDLNRAFVREVNLVGRGRIRCRYAPVRLRITNGATETYEWDAVVAFAPFPVLRSLLGFAGFLRFFNAHFRPDDEEVTLLPNRLFSGQRI
jgi:hypothetical protein